MGESASNAILVSYSHCFPDTIMHQFYMEHLWNMYFANIEPIKCAR